MSYKRQIIPTDEEIFAKISPPKVYRRKTG